MVNGEMMANKMIPVLLGLDESKILSWWNFWNFSKPILCPDRGQTIPRSRFFLTRSISAFMEFSFQMGRVFFDLGRSVIRTNQKVHQTLLNGHYSKYIEQNGRNRIWPLFFTLWKPDEIPWQKVQKIAGKVSLTEKMYFSREVAVFSPASREKT